ncbi:MAG: hypothetical protein IKS44_03730, partial [Bacteroidales bacterium]|nr:hypothetical protein [Bacteroidales bacterium]
MIWLQRYKKIRIHEEKDGRVRIFSYLCNPKQKHTVMLQLQYIKEHTEEIIERLKIKNVQNVEERIAEIIDLDAQRRALQQKADAVKAEQNALLGTYDLGLGTYDLGLGIYDLG